MQWLLGGLIFAAMAHLLRNVLRMDSRRNLPVARLGWWREDLQAIYHPIAQEIETHTAILGITLNDAFNERQSDRLQMAWRVAGLASVEWERLTKLATGLQSVLAKFLPSTNGIVLTRRVALGHFKSRVVVDNIGLYDFLDRVLFGSKPRFALKLRFLSRASTILSKEFNRTCREGQFALESSEEVWTQLDRYFHDLDLIAKETLLAFRTLLACQTPEEARALATELELLLERAPRVSVASSIQ